VRQPLRNFELPGGQRLSSVGSILRPPIPDVCVGRDTFRAGRLPLFGEVASHPALRGLKFSERAQTPTLLADVYEKLSLEFSRRLVAKETAAWNSQSHRLVGELCPQDGVADGSRLGCALSWNCCHEGPSCAQLFIVKGPQHIVQTFWYARRSCAVSGARACRSDWTPMRFFAGFEASARYVNRSNASGTKGWNTARGSTYFLALKTDSIRPRTGLLLLMLPGTWGMTKLENSKSECRSLYFTRDLRMFGCRDIEICENCPRQPLWGSRS